MLDDKDEFLDPAIDLRRTRQRFYYWDKKWRRAKWCCAYWRKKIRKCDAKLADINKFLTSMGATPCSTETNESGPNSTNC